MTVIPIKLPLAEYECGNCGAVFEAHCQPDMVYGPMVVRSVKSGELGYFDTVEERAIDEILAMCKSMPEYSLINENHRPHAASEVYMQLADKPPDGSRYSQTRRPRCPNCSADTTRMLRDTDLRSEALAQQVTFDGWKALPESDRYARVRELIMIQAQSSPP